MSFSTTDDLERRLSRLDPLDGDATAPSWGDGGAQALREAAAEARALTPAAVLVPVVRRPAGWTLLLTVRTATMPTHAGQVAFPGGRVQAEDAGPLATALRETAEEIGLAGRFIRPLGRYGAYQTGTGFAVTPVVAFVEPGFVLKPDPREVDEVFETPLDFLLNPANHQRHSREFNGRTRAFYAMPWKKYYIWGATAGMIRALYERLYG
ncbi:MAG: CoA pyrophosphatase [Hyphomonadaceae bacterium]